MIPSSTPCNKTDPPADASSDKGNTPSNRTATPADASSDKGNTPSNKTDPPADASSDRGNTHSNNNSDEVLTSPAPKFTDCFQTTVVEWIPFFWLVLSVLVYAWVLYARKVAPSLPVTIISIVKSVLCFALLIMTLLQIWAVEQYGYKCNFKNELPSAFYYGIAMRSVSLLFLSLFIQYVRMKGVVSSAVLYIYWLTLLVCGIIPLQSNITYQPSCVSSVLHYLYFAVLCVQVVLHSFADVRSVPGYQALDSDKPRCPENDVSSLAVFTFLWFTPYVIKAFKHTITTFDLWEQTPRLKCENAVKEVLEVWKEEEKKTDIYNSSLQKLKIRKTKYTPNLNGHANGYISAEETPLLSSQGDTNQDDDQKSRERKPSLYKVLIRKYGLIWLHGSLLKVAVDMFMLLQPIILRMIISHIERKESDTADPVWIGYALAMMFFLAGTIQSFLFKNAMQVSMTLGLRIKTALVGIIYRKSLRMSNKAKQTFTVGEIVNLMSVDCQRIQDSFAYGYQVISFVSVLAIGVSEIWGAMGIPTLGCVAFLVILATLNFIFGKLQERYQRALLRLKGDRIKLFNEVLGGIKVLKMYAWEPAFTDKVMRIRQKEIFYLKRIAIVGAFSLLCAINSPFFMCYMVFLIFILMNTSGHLDAQSTFLVLSVVNILRFSITLVPFVVTGIIQLYVSIGRIQKFLWMEDLNENNVTRDDTAEYAVEISNGRFTWNRKDPVPTLANINLKIPEGSLVAVVGSIGSGKSSLMSAILGEMEKSSGSVTVKGSLAYVPQEAWIQNLTLRDNVLYGNQFKYWKYNKVIEACAMLPDLKILQGGDMTEIGQKGINLSGGQKQRVSLARAVYSNSDVYLLDDPLSAVDSHVGKDIFKNVVGKEGLLKNKTRILVTHGIHWLPLVDVIVVMNNGQISEIGTYDHLLQHDGPFAQFLKTYLLNDDVIEEEADPEIEMMKDKLWEQVEAVTSDGGLTSEDNSIITGLTRRNKTKKRKRGISSSDKFTLSRSNSKLDDKPPQPTGQLTQEETARTGSVSWRVSYALLQAMGLPWATLILVFCLLCQGFGVYSNFWLTDWTEDSYLANTSLSHTQKYVDTNVYYLVVYSVLGVLQGVFVLMWSFFALVGLVKAMDNLHMSMLHTVMKSTMSFFDTTPMGRIMNRFSSDVDVMDDRMPRTFRVWSVMFVLVIVVNTVIIIQTPIFTVALAPVFIIYVLLLKFFLPTARQVKRIESVTRSPVYNHFSETISGASIIRAYQSCERFIQESQKRVDVNSTFYHAANISARWIAIIVEFLSNVLVFAAAIFAILSDDLNAGDVGLSLTYAVQLVQILNLLVWAVSEMEMNIVSLERIVEYTDLPSESAWLLPQSRPPHGWPEDGQIEFEHFSTRYRPGLELVLKAIDFKVASGEKVGVVGRTGAGKSSLTLSLFRLIESAGGCIKIDGIRIADLGLHDLRTKITILPQDPVIFSGSIRLNLDPLHLFDDVEIWKALERAHMKSLIRNHRDQLEYECGEGGQNLSFGQRQLVCLGRALLNKNKILILDEATAAVDMETDELIQETIRTEFSDCTVITIAHRLNTVMDYDRVMVMDEGAISEFDTPRNLLKDTGTIFYGMAKDADLASWFDSEKKLQDS